MSNRKFGIEESKKYEKVRKSNGQVYIELNLVKAYKPYGINLRGA